MSWIVYLVLAAFVLYMSYNFAVFNLFGIPKSLSQTYYDFMSYKYWMKILFPIMMVSVGVMLLPAWLEISEGSDFMFTAFLAVGGILFTGFAPAFRSSDLENNVHTGSAVFAAVCALIWVILVAKLWWVIIVCAVIFSVVAFITGTWKKALVFWLENIAFMSTFVAIMAHFMAQ